MKRLPGKQIVLREYFITDAESIHCWRNDIETTIRMGRKFREPASLEETTDSLSKIIEQPPKNALFYAIAEKESLRYIGGIDLTDIDHIDRNAVLSIVIGKDEDRNKGYATEAINILLQYAFDDIKLHKISLNVYENNIAAIRCYCKCGFQEEGRKRDHSFINNEYFDLIQMGILENEFRGVMVESFET